jgi:hypothetical protein
MKHRHKQTDKRQREWSREAVCLITQVTVVQEIKITIEPSKLQVGSFVHDGYKMRYA